MVSITPDELVQYTRIAADRKIRGGDEFTQDMLDYFLTGEKISGIELPFEPLKNRFRLRMEEVTLLCGINGSGKSLLAGQFMLKAAEQGYKSLSISLEMSPKSQLARQVRMASLDVEPTMDYMLDFARWTKNKLWFFDQQGSVDMYHLKAVIAYAVDNFGVDFVVIDSLMTLSIKSDDYNAQKDCINTLANLARALGIHILLVTHARKGVSVKDRLDRWSIRGASELADRADNILILGRTFSTDPEESDAYLDLAKARHFDGAECTLDLYLDLASMNYHLLDEEPNKLKMEEKAKVVAIDGKKLEAV